MEGELSHSLLPQIPFPHNSFDSRQENTTLIMDALNQPDRLERRMHELERRLDSTASMVRLQEEIHKLRADEKDKEAHLEETRYLELERRCSHAERRLDVLTTRIQEAEELYTSKTLHLHARIDGLGKSFEQTVQENASSLIVQTEKKMEELLARERTRINDALREVSASTEKKLTQVCCNVEEMGKVLKEKESEELNNRVVEVYREIDRMRNRIEGGMKEIREDVGHVGRGAAKILGLIESERIEEQFISALEGETI